MALRSFLHKNSPEEAIKSVYLYKERNLITASEALSWISPPTRGPAVSIPTVPPTDGSSVGWVSWPVGRSDGSAGRSVGRSVGRMGQLAGRSVGRSDGSAGRSVGRMGQLAGRSVGRSVGRWASVGYTDRSDSWQRGAVSVPGSRPVPAAAPHVVSSPVYFCPLMDGEVGEVVGHAGRSVPFCPLMDGEVGGGGGTRRLAREDADPAHLTRPDTAEHSVT